MTSLGAVAVPCAGWWRPEDSCRVWAATAAEQLGCGQQARPPVPQWHPQKPVFDNLETLGPAGRQHSLHGDLGRARPAHFLVWRQAGPVWILCCGFYSALRLPAIAACVRIPVSVLVSGYDMGLGVTFSGKLSPDGK